MRLFIISACLGILFLLPAVAALYEFPLPGILALVLHVPYISLAYMDTLFHEMGHAVTFWSFGYIAVPSFSFEFMGGVTPPLTPHLWIMHAAFYVLAGAGVFFLFRGDSFLFDDERHLLLGVGIPLLIFHLAVGFKEDWRQSVVCFMGFGAEIAVAAFCIVRAVLGLTLYGVFERYLNMVFGFFVVGNNIVLLSGLIGSDVMRAAYAALYGSEGMTGDFDQIAQLLLVKTETAAIIAVIYMAVVMAGAGAYIWRELRKKREALEA